MIIQLSVFIPVHRNIYSNRRLVFLLRPPLKNYRRCGGRTFIRLGQCIVYLHTDSRFQRYDGAVTVHLPVR